jgi:hypothetical protein
VCKRSLILLLFERDFPLRPTSEVAKESLSVMLKKLVLVFFCAAYALCLNLSHFSYQSFTAAAQALPPLNYDIVYVRALRAGDNQVNYLPEALTPLLPEPGADLMLLHPNGSEEVLFAAGANGAVMDPSISFDGRSVVFAYFPNVKNSNSQRRADYSGIQLSREGADIYRIDLPTRKVTRLTQQEFSPNTGNGAIYDCSKQFQSNCPEVGVFNTGPAFLPDGRVVYTSTRDNYIPNKPSSHRAAHDAALGNGWRRQESTHDWAFQSGFSYASVCVEGRAHCVFDLGKYGCAR